jgi:ketosteroid isomerase-like protein
MTLPVVTAVAATILCGIPIASVRAQGSPKHAAMIKALEDRFAAACNAKDVDGIMKAYVPDESLQVFDIIPPRQYAGAKAYRKDWEEFLATLKGPLKYEISDLTVAADRTLGLRTQYSTSHRHRHQGAAD